MPSILFLTETQNQLCVPVGFVCVNFKVLRWSFNGLKHFASETVSLITMQSLLMWITIPVDTCQHSTLCAPWACTTPVHPLNFAFLFLRSSLVNRAKEGPEASGKDLLCTSTRYSEEPPRRGDIDKGKFFNQNAKQSSSTALLFPQPFLYVLPH